MTEFGKASSIWQDSGFDNQSLCLYINGIFCSKSKSLHILGKIEQLYIRNGPCRPCKTSRCVNYFLFLIFCWIRIFSNNFPLSHFNLFILFLSQSVIIGCSYISINHASTLLLPRYLPRLCFSNSNKYIWHLNTVHLSDQCWLIHFSDALLVT